MATSMEDMGLITITSWTVT